jgi:hypothetical protein
LIGLSLLGNRMVFSMSNVTIGFTGGKLSWSTFGKCLFLGVCFNETFWEADILLKNVGQTILTS